MKQVTYGTTWDWLNWKSVLVALTLIQGYVLIGSTYLIMKTDGELQTTHYRTAKIATVTTFIGSDFDYDFDSCVL
jgi:cytochrome d ubiquinol oxidase subunit II